MTDTKLILVVDDDPLIQSFLEAFLGSRGYTVLLAADGQTAWEILQASPVRLVIADWQMPDLTGLEICRRIRHELPDPYRYVLMLTGQQDQDAFIEGFEAGADDFLHKPLNPAELRIRVATAERMLSLQHRLEQRSQELVAANESIQAAYQESEASRLVALDAGRLGTWWWNIHDRTCGGDAFFLTLFGLSPSEVSYPIAAFTERITPWSAAGIEAVMETQLCSGQEFENELEIILGPGAGRWIRWRGRVDPQDPALIRGISFDITEQKRTQVALRESEERLQLATEAAGLGIFDVNLVTLDMGWDARQREIWGVPQDAVITDEIFIAGVHPEDREFVRATVARALDPDGNGLYATEYRIVPLDGFGGRWIAATARVHFEGRLPVRLVGTVQDITARKSAEVALRDSEGRFRQFGEASSDVLWIRDAETLAFEYLSPAFEAVYGMSHEEALGGDRVGSWLDVIHPEDCGKVLANLDRVRAGERVQYTFRVGHRSDGATHWLRSTTFPLLDASGRVRRIAGISRDVTGEVELQGRLEVLVAELQHRTRNLLGVVRSLADKTIAGSISLADFRTRFRNRLDALARVNGLLSRLEEGGRITFDELLGAELLAHGALQADGRSGQVSLHGPLGVRLRSSTVQTFALALHELATNAVKYGALSCPEGRLALNWGLVSSPDGEPRLHVDWRESGPPVPSLPQSSEDEASTPPRRGFGRDLIERILPLQLKAETSYELTPDGVRCAIILPVSSRTPASPGLSASGTRLR